MNGMDFCITENYILNVIMKEHIPLLNFIRSNRFMLYVAMFTVLFLAPNTYFMFHLLSRFIFPFREIVSAGVALIVASAIMIYTLRKNEQVALYFSLFEVVISGYYYVDLIGLDWALIPAGCFTIMLPISVYFYTLEIDVDVSGKMSPQERERLEIFLEENPTKTAADFSIKKG